MRADAAQGDTRNGGWLQRGGNGVGRGQRRRGGGGWGGGGGRGFRESRSTIRKLWIYYLTGSFGSLRSDGASIMAGASLWAIFMRQNATHLNRAAAAKWKKREREGEGEGERIKRNTAVNWRNTCMKSAWPDFLLDEKAHADPRNLLVAVEQSFNWAGPTGRDDALCTFFNQTRCKQFADIFVVVPVIRKIR